MTDGPKIIRPFEPPPKSRELALNASRWMEICKRELPSSVGCIMLFFPKNEIGGARGVTVGNVNRAAIQDELKAVLRKWSQQRTILTPEDL